MVWKMNRIIPYVARIATYTVLMIAVCLIGCSSVSTSQRVQEEQEMREGYISISMEEAKQLMEEETDFILLDVRTVEEFEAGHIPGAICIPNETIGEEEIAELPDKEQKILIYCRSGNRSKQAAKKMVELGYQKLVEIGGIIDWTGDIEK